MTSQDPLIAPRSRPVSWHHLARRAALLGLLGLVACTSVPIGTLWALRNTRLETLDPTTLRAALRLPQDVQLNPATLRLDIAVGLTPPGGGDMITFKESLKLQRLTLATDLASLRTEEKSGNTLTAYQVAPGESDKVAALKKKVAATPRIAGKSQLSLGLHFEGCRTAKSGSALIFSSYLRTSEESGYLPVLKDARLDQLLGAEQLLAQIPSCPVK